MSRERSRPAVVRLGLAMSVCSLPLLVLVAVALVRWIA